MSGSAADIWFASVLGGAGWRPARSTAADGAVAAWAESACEPHDAALNFVREFDGLSFTYPRKIAAQGEHECILNAALATGRIRSARIREYENRTGLPLCPIGIAASNHQTMLMAPTGAVFGGYDQFLVLCGDSGRSAIWNIYHNIEPVEFIV